MKPKTNTKPLHFLSSVVLMQLKLCLLLHVGGFVPIFPFDSCCFNYTYYTNSLNSETSVGAWCWSLAYICCSIKIYWLIYLLVNLFSVSRLHKSHSIGLTFPLCQVKSSHHKQLTVMVNGLICHSKTKEWRMSATLLVLASSLKYFIQISQNLP